MTPDEITQMHCRGSMWQGFAERIETMSENDKLIRLTALEVLRFYREHTVSSFYQEVDAAIKEVEQLKAQHDQLLDACGEMHKVFWMIGARVTLAGALPAQIEQIGKQAEAAIALAKG